MGGFSVYAIFAAAWFLPFSKHRLLGLAVLLAACCLAYFDMLPIISQKWS
jgi:hypothetical protein